MDFEKVLELMRALRDHEVEYVLVGAVALGLTGIVRSTEDLDLFVRPTPDNIEHLRAALSAVWPDPAITEITAADLAGEFGVVRYVPPTGELTVDLMARLGDAFAFDDLEWVEQLVAGVVVRVATPRTLYLMKKDTLRPQDRLDAAALREKFRLEDA